MLPCMAGAIRTGVPSLSQRPRAEARVEVTTESAMPIEVLLITL